MALPWWFDLFAATGTLSMAGYAILGEGLSRLNESYLRTRKAFAAQWVRALEEGYGKMLKEPLDSSEDSHLFVGPDVIRCATAFGSGRTLRLKRAKRAFLVPESLYGKVPLAVSVNYRRMQKQVTAHETQMFSAYRMPCDVPADVEERGFLLNSMKELLEVLGRGGRLRVARVCMIAGLLVSGVGAIIALLL